MRAATGKRRSPAGKEPTVSSPGEKKIARNLKAGKHKRKSAGTEPTSPSPRKPKKQKSQPANRAKTYAELIFDRNDDGEVTISDLPAALKQILLLPIKVVSLVVDALLKALGFGGAVIVKVGVGGSNVALKVGRLLKKSTNRGVTEALAILKSVSDILSTVVTVAIDQNDDGRLTIEDVTIFTKNAKRTGKRAANRLEKLASEILDSEVAKDAAMAAATAAVLASMLPLIPAGPVAAAAAAYVVANHIPTRR